MEIEKCNVSFSLIYQSHFSCRKNFLKGRSRRDLYALVHWVKTEIIAGIGFFGVMGGYLLRILNTHSGVIIKPQKRYNVMATILLSFFLVLYQTNVSLS